MYNKLASGLIPLKLKDWHTMKIDADGDQISALINNEVVARIIDSTYTHGMAGFSLMRHVRQWENRWNNAVESEIN